MRDAAERVERCSKCHAERALVEFNAEPLRDGHRAECRECQRERATAASGERVAALREACEATSAESSDAQVGFGE